MRCYKTEGIILKRTNFGEADKILTVYSVHYGKIKLLAKGIRKITSRKGGNLELFNWVGLLIAQGKNLDLVTEVETIKSFKNWRRDLKKVGLAYHFCELVDRLTAEGVPNREIFVLLTQTLTDLADFKNKDQEFERKILEETGFWPRGKLIAENDYDGYIEKIIEKKLRSKNIFKASFFE